MWPSRDGYDATVFSESQQWYDLVYDAQGKDYLEEAERLRLILMGHGISAPVLGRRPRWLDVACGTGRHLVHLPECERVGVDLDPAMLDVARRRCPTVEFEVLDMKSLSPWDATDIPSLAVDARFEVVTCLFSAIAYMEDLEELGIAIRGMASRLSPGGLLLVEPFLTPDMVVEGHLSMNVIDRDDLKLVRMDVPRVEGRRLDLEFHYLAATPAGVDHRIEPHRITLFTCDEIGNAFRAAGLTWEYDSDGLSGRGLHLGTKSSQG